MSDADTSASDKTEDPTEHRIKTAIEKGNTASSREVATLFSLVAMIFVVFIIANGMGGFVAQSLAVFLERPGEWPFDDTGQASGILKVAVGPSAWLIIPSVLLLSVAGVLSASIQNSPRVVFDRIEPKLSRISLKEGFKRTFGSKGLFEFGKSCVKFIAVASIAIFKISIMAGGILAILNANITQIPVAIYEIAMSLLLMFSACALVIAGADYGWVRFTWLKDLRMSTQEVKDEMKQTQGDPLIKGKLKSIAQSRARNRMMAKVPKATLIIANPTHFAVALKYVRSEDRAPRVLAKGKDLIALRIRAVAEEHGIPVIEDKPLARSMYDKVQIDHEVPAEFYKALAKIILFLSATGQLRARRQV